MFGRKKKFQEGYELGLKEGAARIFRGKTMIVVDRDYCTPEIYERIRNCVIECCAELPPGNYRIGTEPPKPKLDGFGDIKSW